MVGNFYKNTEGGHVCSTSFGILFYLLTYKMFSTM